MLLPTAADFPSSQMVAMMMMMVMMVMVVMMMIKRAEQAVFSSHRWRLSLLTDGGGESDGDDGNGGDGVYFLSILKK